LWDDKPCSINLSADYSTADATATAGAAAATTTAMLHLTLRRQMGETIENSWVLNYWAI